MKTAQLFKDVLRRESESLKGGITLKDVRDMRLLHNVKNADFIFIKIAEGQVKKT